MTTTYTPSQLAAMTVGQLNALSPAQFASFNATQIQALSALQINGLSGANFATIKLSYLSKKQISGLSASELSGVSIANFDEYIAGDIDLLGAPALKGLTSAQLASMSATQIASLSATQVAAMAPAQASYVNAYNAVMTDVSAHLSSGSLTFSGAEQILRDAAAGGMNAGKFAALQAAAKELNAASGASIGASAMVQGLFDDVVLGNAANAEWNGGSSAATRLGNLTAASSAAQVNELIGKWFLGTDDRPWPVRRFPQPTRRQAAPCFPRQARRSPTSIRARSATVISLPRSAKLRCRIPR